MSSLKSTESIIKGFDVATKNPVIFVPAVAPLVIHLLFVILAYVVFPVRYTLSVYPYPHFARAEMM